MARSLVLGFAFAVLTGASCATAAPLVAGAVLIRQPGTLEHAAVPGTAVLRVLARAGEPVREVALDLSSGDAAFDAAALGTVRRWCYVPALAGKSPEAEWLLIRLVSRPAARLARLNAR